MTIPKPTWDGFVRFVMYLAITSIAIRFASTVAPGATEKIRTQLLV